MKTEYISLWYKPNEPDGPWHMSTSPTKTPKGKDKYDKIKVDPGDTAVLKFTIKTKDIHFNPANPIDIRPADPQKPGDPAQFTKTIDKDGVLNVNDPNSDAAPTDYYYQLNFVDKPSLDPIIQNGCCGGGGGLQYNATYYALGAVALLALIYLVARPFLRKRSTGAR
jgi:hypothetical protein